MTALLAPLVRYGPPLAWMLLIGVLSGDRLSAEATGSWIVPLLTALLPGTSPPVVHGLHLVLRKLGHVVEFGVLGVLWLHALAPDSAPTKLGGSAAGRSTPRPPQQVVAGPRRRVFGRSSWAPNGAGPARAGRAIALATLYAIVDEGRQGLTVSRSPSWLDVGLDTAGAWIAIAGIGGSRGSPVLLRGARSLATLVAVGSLAAVLADGALGRAPWDAGLAALGAAVAALALHRAARRAG